MPDHYFSRRPETAPHLRVLPTVLRGMEFRFTTDAGVFSQRGIDAGTRLLIESVELPAGAAVCDLGCGYGVLGLVAARMVHRVVLIDVNERAVQLARRNLESHGIANSDIVLADGLAAFRSASFNLILCNPPIRAGNAVVHRLFEESLRALKTGGKFWMVAQTKQGAKSMHRKLIEVFGRAELAAVKSGYRVLVATK